MYRNKGDYEKALYFLNRSLKIFKEIGDNRGIGITLNNIGSVYLFKGDLDTALDY